MPFENNRSSTRQGTHMTDKPPDPKPAGAPPVSPPARRKNRDAERIRKEAETDGGGDAPMDPADEKFIDSK